VRTIEQAESEALLAAQEWAAGHYDAEHRFTAADIRLLHRCWLGDIYEWAGEYRRVNVSKGDFMFAAADRIEALMNAFSSKELAASTPCVGMTEDRLVQALALTHAELVLIHPFREGNGRCARLLTWLMALQAGQPSLDFTPLAGRGKAAYVAAIHQAVERNYEPMEQCFRRVVSRTLRLYRGHT
jgi:cell filamentation protein